MDSIKPEVKIYAIVRDKAGKPKIDGDPRDLHWSIRQDMTQGEYEVACEEYDQKMKDK